MLISPSLTHSVNWGAEGDSLDVQLLLPYLYAAECLTSPPLVFFGVRGHIYWCLELTPAWGQSHGARGKVSALQVLA